MNKELLNRISNLQNQLNELTQELEEDSHCPEMVKIRNREYALGKYPVTVLEYQAFVNDTSRDQTVYGDPLEPVTRVNYKDATDYVEWLSAKTGRTFRLPSEDEWEYCCADHKKGNEEIAYYDQERITTVGTKKPNKFGLYDMLGLVWEWTK